MKVNLLPAMRAYCEERIKLLGLDPASANDRIRIDELQSVVELCVGLEKQQSHFDDLLSRASMNSRPVPSGIWAER